MKHYTIQCSTILIVFTLFSCASKNIRLDVQDLVRQSRFVFKGTIVKLNATTVPSIQDTSRTAIIEVDEVYGLPKNLGDYTGQEITVLLRQPQTVDVGQQAFFFTRGWAYGKSVAVIEVGHLESGEASKKLREQVVQAIEALPDQRLQVHLASADLVVVGKVSKIRLADGVNRPRAFTEHHPQFREAVIEIESMEKGSYTQENITILFPGSSDVMWFRSPKFHVGQEGIWILHKHSIPELKRDFYVSYYPSLDFFPKTQRSRIRRLIKDID